MKKKSLKYIFWLFLVNMTGLCFLSPAQAQEFTFGVATDFPLGAGLNGSVHIPDRQVFARLGGGKFLASYTDAMNSVAEDMDFYNSATSAIISESLSDAFYWEFALGWAQAPHEGWFVDFAYFSVTGQGQVTGEVIIEAVSGVNIPVATNLYDIEGEVQAIVLKVGRLHPLSSKGSLAWSVGVLKPIESSTQIDREVTGPVQQALLDAANRELDAYMQDTLENDVWIPVLSLGWVY